MKPRERLLSLGPDVLSDHELLQILLSPGNGRISSSVLSNTMIQSYGSLDNIVQRRPAELARLPGMGTAKACRVLAAMELGRRATYMLPQGPFLNSPKDVYAAVTDLVHKPVEECLMLTVNTKNRLLQRYSLATGTMDSCHLEPRDLFSMLLKEGATRFFVVHNHPSGDPKPSPSDTALTKRLLWGCGVIGLAMLDHVVVGTSGYCSLRTNYPELGTWG